MMVSTLVSVHCISCGASTRSVDLFGDGQCVSCWDKAGDETHQAEAAAYQREYRERLKEAKRAKAGT